VEGDKGGLRAMYRCPTCVSVLTDHKVRRCPVCGENFKRRPPAVLGADRRGRDKLTSWDIKAHSEASRLYAQEDVATKPTIDLPKEHLRDSSGRTAAADRR
jgi:predicted  nucleic acid-binding Zn-ribbon protein